MLSRRLFVYDIREREEARVASGVIRGFSFSPDSKSIVFGTAGRNDAADAPSDLYSVALEDAARRRITRDRKSLNPLWGPAGIVHDRFSARDGDAPTYNLFEIQPDGGSLRRITRLRVPPLMSGLVPLELSGNGKRMLAEFVGQDSSLAFRVNPETGKTQGARRRFRERVRGLRPDRRRAHRARPHRRTGPDRPAQRGDDARTAAGSRRCWCDSASFPDWDQ